jgi:hypothetical protein
MNKLTYFFIFLFIINIALAKDYPVQVISDCASDITISVSGNLPIDDGEYGISGCTSNVTNVWKCPCVKIVPITFSAPINAINVYTIQVSYVSYNYENVASHNSGSGKYVPPKLVNNTVIINTTPTPIIPPTNITQPIQPNTPNPVYQIDRNITNNVTITPTTTEHKVGFFMRLWLWIKKILFYKIF